MFVTLAIFTLFITIACIYFYHKGTPQNILFLYLIGCVFINTVHSLYNFTNYLGFGKEWSFLDLILLFLVVIVWLTSNPWVKNRSSMAIWEPMMLIGILATVNFLMGSISAESEGVLNYSRKFLFIPIFFISLRILNKRIIIEKYYNYIKYTVLFVFLFHCLVAFRYISIPLPVELSEMLIDEGASFLRVEFFFAPLIYVLAYAISLCEIIYKKGKLVFNGLVCSVAVIGVLLTQTRSYYLALFVVTIFAFIKITNSIKFVLMLSICLVVILFTLQSMSIDIFYRFKDATEQTNIKEYSSKWRGQEYNVIYDELANEPLTIFTGQGFAKRHKAPFSSTGYVNFFHNEYLKVVSSLGLFGLLSYLYILWKGVSVSQEYVHSSIGHIISPVILMMLASCVSCIFVGFTWHPGFGPIMLSLFSILANIEILASEQDLPVTGKYL